MAAKRNGAGISQSFGLRANRRVSLPVQPPAFVHEGAYSVSQWPCFRVTLCQRRWKGSLSSNFLKCAN